MTTRNLLIQPWAEQFGRLRQRRLRTYRTRRNLREIRYWQNHTLQILHP
jgi:ribosome biogenesis protein Tsr3